MNIFFKYLNQILQGMGSVYTLDSLSPYTPKNLFYRREMSCMGLDNCLKYRVEKKRGTSQALLGFVIYISGFEGLRCE